MENLHNIRGNDPDRKARQLFRTPRYAFEPLFAFEPEWFKHSIIDPSAGDGRMIALAVELGNRQRHFLGDLASSEGERWKSDARLDNAEHHVGDYLVLRPNRRFGAMVTNPPFTEAQNFVEHAKGHVDGAICILQSVAWMGTQKRSQWLANASGLRWVLNIARRPRWEFDDGLQGASNIWDFAWYVFFSGYRGKPEVDWLFDVQYPPNLGAEDDFDALLAA